MNLPVKDLAASTRFHEAIGCKKNEQFSDAKAASMVWSDSIAFQLVKHEYFATFTTKPIANAHERCGALIALTQDTREAVDETTEAAAAERHDGTCDSGRPQHVHFLRTAGVAAAT